MTSFSGEFHGQMTSSYLTRGRSCLSTSPSNYLRMSLRNIHTNSDVFTSIAMVRGSASGRQLNLIEKPSSGSGDRLAGIRFSKNLMVLD